MGLSRNNSLRMTNSVLQKMSCHGRGRGLRRNFEGSEKPGNPGPGGKWKAESRGEQEDLRAKIGDSPIPDTFTLPDLIQLINKVDIEKAEDKKAEGVWRITKSIKHLCSSEESLR